MNNEKVYQFNEYVLGYDKGLKDRSCLTISKIQNGNMYVMSSLYDGSADVISTLLDDLQQEYKNSQITLAKEWKKRLEAEEKIKHLDNQITMLKQQNNVITETGLNYKSRIDKAIEYCDKEIGNIIAYFDYIDTKDLENVRKILKGDDENEER